MKTNKLANQTFWVWAIGSLSVYLGLIGLVVISCLIYAGIGDIVSASFSEEILFATKLSVLTALLSTVLSLFLAIPSAYALSQYKGRWKNLVDTLMDIPLVLPPVAVGVALLVFFSQFPTQNASLDKWLRRLGMPVVFELPAIVVAQFAVIVGYSIRVLKAAFDGLNPRLRDVSKTLGLSRWHTLFWVELPQVAPSLLAATILLWARAMGEFGATVILAGATALKTEVLTIAIFITLNRAEVDKALAGAFVLVSVSIVALFSFRKLVSRNF